jgi:hypothetical protein
MFLVGSDNFSATRDGISTHATSTAAAVAIHGRIKMRPNGSLFNITAADQAKSLCSAFQRLRRIADLRRRMSSICFIESVEADFECNVVMKRSMTLLVQIPVDGLNDA